MQSPLTILVLFVLILYTNTAPADKNVNGENFKLIILHNNDMHARFEQTNVYSSRCNEEDARKNKCFGGFARVAHVVREYRRKAASNESPKVLYLNAGDTYTGTPWFSIFKDNITATFLDILMPDAISLGNHEFDEGSANLALFLREVKFPVLAANLILDNEPELITESLKPSHVFEIDGKKIGVIGYLTPETKEVAGPNNVEFTDEVEAINKEAETLKKLGVDIIIALGHSGIERDKQIAHNCPHLDLIIGGHSHTFLYSGQQPDIEAPYDTYPVNVIQQNGKIVPVVQSYAYTKYLGYLSLEFDSSGNLIEIDGTPILLNGTIERESDVLQMLELYRPAVLELQNEIVGSTRVHLDGNCRRRECNLGNFIADSMVDWNVKRYSGTGWTDAAIGIIQGGGVRASIERNSKGITMEDLQTVSPFESKIVLIEITGKILLEALEHSVYRYTDGEERGEFLQYSGLYVEYDMNQPSGRRVTNVKVLCAYCEVPKLENVLLTKKYRVIVQDFLANGGDGYVMFKNTQIQESETLDIDVLKSFVKKKSPIYPAIEWRITIREFLDPSEEILGYTRVFLDGNCYRTECNLGNFIADAFVDWYSLNYETSEGWTRSSIALIPANNIKNSINHKDNNGVITKKDGMDVLPLNNHIVVVNITGEILKEILEYAINRYDEGIQLPEFLQMSGLNVEYDLKNKIGQRVVSVKLLCSNCTSPNFEDLNYTRKYSVLMSENVANGGLGFSMLKNYTGQVLKITELDVFALYLKRKSPIYPSVEWRIILNHLDPSQDIVGKTRVYLSNDCSKSECNLGNIIADSMVDWYASNYVGVGWTDASIAIVESDKIKSSISIGDIYRSDIEKVFDSSQNLQIIFFKGQDLLDLLEFSVATFGNSNYNHFLQVSGMQITFDMNKAAGHRISDIKLMCSYCELPELIPLNTTDVYKIIIQSSLISDKYFEIVEGKEIIDLQETNANVFIQYLKKRSPVYPSVEWRITLIEDAQNTVTPVESTTSTISLAATYTKVSMILLIFSTIISIFFLRIEILN